VSHTIQTSSVRLEALFEQANLLGLTASAERTSFNAQKTVFPAPGSSVGGIWLEGKCKVNCTIPLNDLLNPENYSSGSVVLHDTGDGYPPTHDQNLSPIGATAIRNPNIIRGIVVNVESAVETDPATLEFLDGSNNPAAGWPAMQVHQGGFMAWINPSSSDDPLVATAVSKIRVSSLAEPPNDPYFTFAIFFDYID
jgi:hypothetical protein